MVKAKIIGLENLVTLPLAQKTLPGPHMDRLNGFVNFFVFAKIFHYKIRYSYVLLKSKTIYRVSITTIRTGVFREYLHTIEKFASRFLFVHIGPSRVFDHKHVENYVTLSL